MSRTVSLTVSGTPAAVVVDEPKLDRMSDRTIPESSRTLTPLDPSPGYGPAVSSSTSVRVPAASEEALEVPLEVLEVLEVPLDVVDEEPVAVDPVPVLQAASAARAPTPPRTPSARRRFMVPRS